MSDENFEPDDIAEELRQLHDVGDGLASAVAPLLDVEERLRRIMGDAYRRPEQDQIPGTSSQSANTSRGLQSARHPTSMLRALVNGTLTADERDQVSLHLTGCPRCRSLVEAMRRHKRQGDSARARPHVFINYRTSDEANAATLIDLDLSRRFGAEQIFFAPKSIKAGENFPEALRRAARSSRVLLAVIGPDWLTARNAHGRNALDDENDWVRHEILEALQSGAIVIPVLVDGTPPLSAAALPPALHTLAERQYRRFSHRAAQRDLDQLSQDIAELVPGLIDITAAEPGGADARAQSTISTSARNVNVSFLNQAQDVSGGSGQ